MAALGDDQTAVTAAMRRDAHVCEFAINCHAAAAIRHYMAGKLSNYVQVTQQ